MTRTIGLCAAIGAGTDSEAALRAMSDQGIAEDEEIIACLLSEREQAIRGDELARELFPQVAEIVELPDGYGYRFASDDSLPPLLEFIAAERRCCPFLAFELAFEPHAVSIWLRMRGSPRVKAFLAEMFNERGLQSDEVTAFRNGARR